MKHWRCGKLYDDEERNDFVRHRSVARGYESLIVTPRGDYFIILESSRGSLLQWVAPTSLRSLFEDWDRDERRTQNLVAHSKKRKKGKASEQVSS